MSPELYHLALWTTSSVIASVIAMWGLRALADHRVRQRDARALEALARAFSGWDEAKAKESKSQARAARLGATSSATIARKEMLDIESEE